MKKLLSVLIMIAMLPLSVFAYDGIAVFDDMCKKAVASGEAYAGDEWTVIAAARGGIDCAGDYLERYLENAGEYINEKNGILHGRKYTEYSRMIIALTAVGADAENIGGYNLLYPLGDYEKTTMQGINGSVWAIIAADSGGYDIPENHDANIKGTRELYLDTILSCQNDDGGWAIAKGESSDIDVTAMVLAALPNYRDKARDNIDKALSYISENQNENGGFLSWGKENSESAAQVLIALCSLSISPNDARFTKNGNGVLENLLTYYDGNGGFYHTHDDKEANKIATEQAFLALAAYKRYLSGKSGIYDMRGFRDIENNKSKAKIEALAAKGIISGKSKFLFNPNDNMTRAEFACIAARAIGLELSDKKYFDDVSENEWYYKYIAAAYENDIISGVSESEFNPNGTITYEEAAAMVSRAAKRCGKYKEYAKSDEFRNVSEWARDALVFCRESGILNDYLSDYRQDINRAAVADMIYNLIEENK